jgi:hypothetical protein
MPSALVFIMLKSGHEAPVGQVPVFPVEGMTQPPRLPQDLLVSGWGGFFKRSSH